MAAQVFNAMAKPVAKKYMQDEVNRQGQRWTNDPYYETRIVNGKPKKFRKAIPDFVPQHDAKILAKCQKRAHRLDKCWSLCGVRFGVSSLWGLFPEVGDVIDLFMAVRLVSLCDKIDGGLPSSTKSMMYLMVALDFIVGLVPFLGDALDVMIKANVINVNMLERHLIERHDPNSKTNKKRMKQGLAPAGRSEKPNGAEGSPPRVAAQPEKPGSRQNSTAQPQPHTRADMPAITAPPTAYNAKDRQPRSGSRGQQGRSGLPVNPSPQRAPTIPVRQDRQMHAQETGVTML